MPLRAFCACLGLTFTMLVVGCGNDDPAGPSNAPASHTVNQDGVRHAPGLNDPEQFCVSCHGADLRGAAEAPSCYECHGARWN